MINTLTNTLSKLKPIDDLIKGTKSTVASKLKPIGDQITNFRVAPNHPTLGQAWQQTVSNPNSYLPYRMTQGNITGAKPIDDYFIRPAGFAADIPYKLATLGLGPAHKMPEARTVADRIGQGVGYVAGLPASFLLGGRVFGTLDKVGTGTLSRIAPSLAQRTIPRVLAGEAAQTAGYGLASTAIKGKFDPVQDLAFGLGARGVLGAVGKTLGGTRNIYRRPHPDDARMLDQAVDILKGKKSSTQQVIRARRDMNQLLNDYVKERMPAKEFEQLYKGGSLNKQIKVLQDFFRNADEVSGGMRSSLVGDSQKAGNINLNRLNVSKTAKTKLTREVKKLKTEIEQVRGKRLSNAEVIEAAKEADALSKVVTRDDTRAFNAQLLKLRQAVARGSQGKGVTPEFLDSLKALSSQATDTASRLQSFSINADPVMDSTKIKLVARLLRLGHNSEEILKQAKNVDFNDSRQAVAFYRQFEKAGLREILEEYRYMNLLSSPRTHIVNVFSNAIQAGALRPATRATEALIDPVASALSGRKRQVYMREVPAYYRGMFGAVPEALKTVQDVFSGKQAFTNLDLNERIPTNSRLSKVNVVTPALEAMDQFFQTLIRGGETAALTSRGGMSKTAIAKQAKRAGEYSVFRQELNPAGQGAVLNWVDEGTKAVMRLRKVPGMGWFVPFIQTPMNIFKQGVEYSPAGFATTIGASNKTEQVSKAALGSMVFFGAGYLALQDRITWSAPKDPEQRKAFYAAGMQPYAVKIGDKWVSFSKVGPVAYPLALAAAIKYGYKDNPQAVAKGELEKMGDSLSGVMGFFADQSYMQGIGDLVNAVQGQEGYQSTTATALGNIAGQYVPLASLQRWVTQIIDPYYRKGDSVIGNLAKGIPGLSTGVGTYEDPLGNPSQRQFPLANAFSPLSISEQNEPFTRLYDARQANLQQNALSRAFKEGKDVSTSTVNRILATPKSTAGTTPLDDKVMKFEINAAVEQVRMSEQPTWVGTTYIYKEGDSVHKIDIGDLEVEAPELTGKSQVDKKLISSYKGKVTSKANDIVKLYQQGVITADEAEALLNQLEAQRNSVTGGASGRKLSGMPELKLDLPKPGRASGGQSNISDQAGVIRKLRLADAKPITAPRLQ